MYYTVIWYLVFLTTILLESLIWTGPAKAQTMYHLCICNDCMRLSFNPIFFSLFSSPFFVFSHFHEIDGCGSHEYDAWPRPTKLILIHLWCGYGKWLSCSSCLCESMDADFNVVVVVDDVTALRYWCRPRALLVGWIICRESFLDLLLYGINVK